MTLSYACIAPHGGEVIPELATPTTLRTFQKTREGMIRLAKETASVGPSTIVIATPHGLRLWKNIGIVTAQYSSGSLQTSQRNKYCVNLKVRCNQEFAKKLLEHARKNELPVVGANYGSAEGATSKMPMDWGTLVPLWFIMKSCRRKPSVVIVTPSREVPLSWNYEFGQVVAALAERETDKVVFVASADQAHAHKESGPYGFSKKAAEYDQFVIDAIRRDRLRSIMSLRSKLVEDAKADGLWQMAMLSGALSKVSMRAELFSYQVPSYYGMICAGFRRR